MLKVQASFPYLVNLYTFYVEFDFDREVEID